MPLVSVVIPTYNRESSIKDSLESVLRQTFTDFEVVVVDDCSDDDTLSVLAEIKDPRVRVLRHSANRGAGAARNTGVRAAQGTFVAFQDSDDEWLPRKLEKQLLALERFDATAIGVYCGMIVLLTPLCANGDSVALQYRPFLKDFPMEGDLKTSLLRGLSLISTQTFVVRRDAFLECGGFDETLKALQDWDCVIRVADYGPIAFVPEPLVIQRFSPNSLTHSAPNRVQAMRTILEKYRHEFGALPTALSGHYYRLAGGYRRLGEFSHAQTFFLQSLKLDPFRPKTWLSLGYAYVCRVLSPVARIVRLSRLAGN